MRIVSFAVAVIATPFSRAKPTVGFEPRAHGTQDGGGWESNLKQKKHLKNLKNVKEVEGKLPLYSQLVSVLTLWSAGGGFLIFLWVG